MKQAARWLLAYLVLLAVVAVAVAVAMWSAAQIAPHLPPAITAAGNARQGLVLAEANADQLRAYTDAAIAERRLLILALIAWPVLLIGGGLVYLALRAQRRERWMLEGRRHAVLPADLVPSDTTRCVPLELRWGITAEEVRARIAEYQARGKERR